MTITADQAPKTSARGANLARDTLTLYRRAIIRKVRTPVQLYFALVQPLIWFLLFGQLFSRLTTGFGAAAAGAGAGAGATNPITAQFATENYSAFFLPAIIVQMLLLGSTNSALGIINDDLSGYLNKLRVSPINRLSILAGSLLADLTRLLAQVAILLGFGVLLGVHLKHASLVPLIFVLAVLFGSTMGGLGLFIGLATRNTQATFLIINFFTLPLLFTSSAMLPATLLPEWLQMLTRFNPLTYAIDGIRAIVVGLNAQQIENGQSVLGVVGLATALLVALATIALGAATWRFRKQVR